MATQKLKKNLPKRCTSERLKARRAASWARGQERKALRRAAQERRERVNRSRLGPTPHQEAKAKAAENRPPARVTGDRPRVVNKSTSYDQIRRQLHEVYLTIPGITEAYLDDIHRRWTRIGKELEGGGI